MDVSVIVPCYNSERTLERCLNSLIDQTLRIDIILIDDGSTDNTLRIAKEYEAKHNNIMVITQVNKGLPQSRKTGLLYVATKYVAFVDSDDWIESNMMEVLFNKAESYHAEIVACEILYERGSRTHFSRKSIGNVDVVDGKEALRLIHQRDRVYPYMCNKLFLTETVKNAVFPLGNFIGEDYLTISSFIEKCKSVVIIDDRLYHYELNVGTMSKNGFGPGHRRAFDNYSKAYKEFAATHNQLETYEMVNYLFPEFGAIIVAMARNLQIDHKVIKDIQSYMKHYFKEFLRTKNRFSYKIASILIVINPYIFINLYRCYGLITKNI